MDEGLTLAPDSRSVCAPARLSLIGDAAHQDAARPGAGTACNPGRANVGWQTVTERCVRASWIDAGGKHPGLVGVLLEFTMNTETMARCAWVLGLVAAVSVAACTDEKRASTGAQGMPATTAGSQAETSWRGVKPAEPAAEQAATRPAANSDLSAIQRSASMPMPGQANDHSTLSPQLKVPASH